ncbi:hypothetical protein ACGFWD_42760 [Streptomyces sp. NPDC048448]|uniref:hypothetical protein n=1 Tax=Streptomyces sp. NPDC048448 TaxID=3365554 RepID=UPI0037117D47
MTNIEAKNGESGRKPRKSWREVPLAFLAVILVGIAVLNFVSALFSLGSGFSAGRLADALIRLVIQLLIDGAVLWIFIRLRSRTKRRSTQN